MAMLWNNAWPLGMKQFKYASIISSIIGIRIMHVMLAFWGDNEPLTARRSVDCTILEIL